MAVLSANAAPYLNAANSAATAYSIPPQIFQAMIQKESSWNIAAVSSAGAYGLTQLMGGTARDLGVNRYDTNANIQGGAKYLRQMYDKFGNWRDALRAYNQGPNNSSLATGGGAAYADTILGWAQQLGWSPGADAAVSALEPASWFDRAIGALKGGIGAGMTGPVWNIPGGAVEGALGPETAGDPIAQALASLKANAAAVAVYALAAIIIIFSVWALFSNPANDVKQVAKFATKGAIK